MVATLRIILIMSMLWLAAAQAGAPRLELVAASAAEFAHPHDLVVDAGGRYLYVADVNHHDIKVLDAMSLQVRGSIGAGELDSPHDVAFAGAGRLLVADSGNDRIVLYDVEGTHGTLTKIYPGHFASPEGVTIDSTGTVYATNAASHSVVAIAPDGTRRSTGRAGGARGRFRRPHDIEAAPDGTLYVADPGNNRIQLLDSDLQVRGVLGADLGLHEPKYLALDARGWLYIADEYNDRLVVLDDRRAVVTIVGEAQGVDLNNPEGVTVRGEDVWVSDTYNDRVLRLRWNRAPAPRS